MPATSYSRHCLQPLLEGQGLTPDAPVTGLCGAPQDAQSFWERNKNEEGGGGYLAWNWDSSIWGADVLLAQLQTSDPKYASEVHTCSRH